MTTNQLMWLDQDGLRVGGTQLWTSGGGVGIGTSSIYGGLTVGNNIGTSSVNSNVSMTVFGPTVHTGGNIQISTAGYGVVFGDGSFMSSAAVAQTMTLISTQTATAGTTTALQWTGLSGYIRYLMFVENLQPSTNDGLRFLLGIGSGPTYLTSGYGGYFGYSPNNGSNQFYGGSLGSSYMTTGITTYTGSYGVNGNFTIDNFNLATSLGVVQIYGTAFTYNGSAGYWSSFNGYNTGTTPYTAIKIQFNGTTTFSGQASLYSISS